MPEKVRFGQSELRRNRLTGATVVLATNRSDRPTDSNGCPFCPGQEHRTTQETLLLTDSGTGNWKVRCIVNLLPALVIEGHGSEFEVTGEIMEAVKNPHGCSEVIVLTPEHNVSFDQFGSSQIALILSAYQQRLVDLSQDKEFGYILIFTNYGREAGASISHPHSQVIATPNVPEKIRTELSHTSDYLHHKGQSLFTKILELERQLSHTIVEESEHFVVFCPWASIHSYETWIAPQQETCYFQDSAQHFPELAEVISRTFQRLAKVKGQLMPFNSILYTAPPRAEANGYRWHFKILPRLTQYSGFELGGGWIINSVLPEQAAAFLREAL